METLIYISIIAFPILSIITGIIIAVNFFKFIKESKKP